MPAESTAAPPLTPSPEPPWRAGLRGVRANALPGFVLQAAALVLVVMFYHHPPTRDALERLRAFRQEAGFGFSVVSTALFGGLVPFLYLRWAPGARGRYGWRQGAALTLFWGYKGIEVDLWYRLMAFVVGPGIGPATIATKVVLDQFVYCPAFAVPVTVLYYEWVEGRFARGPVAADLRAGRWYARRVLPVLVSNLGVWVPATAIIYALPTPLQLPLQNVVLCFFTLLLAHLTARRR
jgi:hypothetical protein